MAQTRISGPKAAMLPTDDQGNPNPLWDLLNYADIQGIRFHEGGDGTVTSDPITDYGVLTLPTVLGMVPIGITVTGYPAWIEFADAAATEVDVPAYVPGTTYDTTDEQGNVTTHQRKWSGWKDNHHNFTTIDPKVYIPTNAMGQDLKNDVLAQLQTDGYTLVSLPEMQALMPQDGP